LGLIDVARLARLDVAIVECLALFDVLERLDDRFGFQDVVAAREARRLLSQGLSLAEVVRTAIGLRRYGQRLSEVSLAEAPWGAVLQQVGNSLSRLDGQYLLDLDHEDQSVDDLFAEAEAREAAGDLLGAEGLYRKAGQLAPDDPVIPFNRGNVLDGLGQHEAAALAYYDALKRDATFAEAWLNLGAPKEARGDGAAAEGYLWQALKARPDYDLALQALADLLLRQERYRESAALWERYAKIARQPEEAARALRRAQLYRMQATHTA
jgi:tetratricopeptide (TPR) repeat protein